MEDDARDVVFEGLRFEDLNLFYGSILMSFKLHFNATVGNDLRVRFLGNLFAGWNKTRLPDAYNSVRKTQRLALTRKNEEVIVHQEKDFLMITKTRGLQSNRKL